METSVLDANPLLILGASLALVVTAIVVSQRLGLGAERSIISASIRAAVQLIGVGLLLTLLIGTGWERWLAWSSLDSGCYLPIRFR